VRSDVGILDDSTGRRTLGQLRDLSGSGTCLCTRTALPVGKPLRLAFQLAAEGEPIRLQGEVVWSGRAESPRGGVLSGVRFLHLAGADVGKLRAFIDERLWAVQHSLCSLELFADMSDIEKLLLASVAFHRDLKPGEPLEEAASESVMIVVRSGSLSSQECMNDGRVTASRTITAGDVCGALPVDPRGSTRVKLRAESDASLLCIPGDSFWYLWTTHAETALKLLACWSLTLRDRLLAVEPRA